MNDDYIQQAISWHATSDSEFPFQAQWRQQQLTIRINDFPAESLYTLLVNDQAILDFDDWPRQWQKP